MFDVDIDVPNNKIRERFGVPASIITYGDKDISRPHPSGVYYCYNMPVDPETNRAAIDYKIAEQAGFIKIDILTNSYYAMFKSKEEILYYMNDVEMNWEWLMEESLITQLPHISNHYDMVQKLRPSSIEELADLLALIRPGKIALLDRYMNNKQEVRKVLYKKSDGYHFKKSHAISLAILITIVAKKIKLPK